MFGNLNDAHIEARDQNNTRIFLKIYTPGVTSAARAYHALVCKLLQKSFMFVFTPRVLSVVFGLAVHPLDFEFLSFGNVFLCACCFSDLWSQRNSVSFHSSSTALSSATS